MFNGLNVGKFIILGCALFAAQSGWATADSWQLNLFKGVTPVSKDIYYLHMTALKVCLVIGTLVFGIMIYSLINHRKSKGYTPATFSHNLLLELVWFVIPLLILIGLAIPATRIMIRMDDTNLADITVKIVGYQWRWQYEYMDQGITYFSNLSTPEAQIQNQEQKGEWYLSEVDKPLVLPVNKKIRFLVTSNDVIHSWWVPELGVKRDAIPGFMYESWAKIEKTGVYRGQCSELCGVHHAFMPIVVKAVNEEEFTQWVALQNKVTKTSFPSAQNRPETLASNELMDLGKQKYEQMCAACHKTDGSGLPPTFPALKASRVAVGPVDKHISIILNGVAGSAMQPYKEQLSDKEIAAITTYERNAWGNNTHDMVQPADVAKLRQAK